MISRKDLNPNGYIETPEINLNLNVLFDRVHKLIEAGAPIERVTSGLRSDADQARINPSAPKSKHLIGAAVDIADPKGYLCNWVINNLSLVKQLGLYIENPAATPGWIHFQIFAPKSGNVSFIP